MADADAEFERRREERRKRMEQLLSPTTPTSSVETDSVAAAPASTETRPPPERLSRVSQQSKSTPNLSLNTSKWTSSTTKKSDLMDKLNQVESKSTATPPSPSIERKKSKEELERQKHLEARDRLTRMEKRMDEMEKGDGNGDVPQSPSSPLARANSINSLLKPSYAPLQRATSVSGGLRAKTFEEKEREKRREARQREERLAVLVKQGAEN